MVRGGRGEEPSCRELGDPSSDRPGATTCDVGPKRWTDHLSYFIPRSPGAAASEMLMALSLRTDFWPPLKIRLRQQ
jgi:hypothetical protein